MYIGVDGIAKSYTLQNHYYEAISNSVSDYVKEPDSFSVDFTKQIYHLPTWRMDLIPDSSCDLVLCVQVLPELSDRLVKKAIREFQRLLKPGGMLYVFDHGNKWKPGGNLDIDRAIERAGFSLEFRPYVADGRDTHGQIRIYRKRDPEIDQANQSNLKIRFLQFYADADALTGGLLTRLTRFKKQKLG